MTAESSGIGSITKRVSIPGSLRLFGSWLKKAQAKLRLENSILFPPHVTSTKFSFFSKKISRRRFLERCCILLSIFTIWPPFKARLRREESPKQVFKMTNLYGAIYSLFGYSFPKHNAASLQHPLLFSGEEGKTSLSGALHKLFISASFAVFLLFLFFFHPKYFWFIYLSPSSIFICPYLYVFLCLHLSVCIVSLFFLILLLSAFSC